MQLGMVRMGRRSLVANGPLGAKPGRSAIRAGVALAAAGLALLIAALPADAVTSSLYAPGLTAPGGMVWMGSHLWVSDHLQGFCRLDGPTTSGTYAINPATCNAAASVPGQPGFQADRGFVYVPDTVSNSQGVWRLTFDPVSETVFGAVALPNLGPGAMLAMSQGSGTLLAMYQGSGGARPSAVAVGPDHNLYVASFGTSDLKRVNNPGGGTGALTVQQIGRTASGSGASGLTFVGSDLYVAELGVISVVRNATGCQPSTPCDAYATPIVVSMPSALTSDAINVLWFADTPVNTSNIVSYTVSTGSQAVYTSSGLLAPTTATLFSFATALALDPTGHLYIGDDPSGGLQRGTGRAWRVTPGVL